MSKMSRRAFFGACRRQCQAASLRIMQWSPVLAAFGFRFHRYANPQSVRWTGWITWCGRHVGFVP